jgi:Uma2 family endonuclease
MATVIEQAVPPLSAGDFLTREEFFRIWEMHPEIKRAELIGGIVYMGSPVSLEHGCSHTDVTSWLKYYAAFTPGTESGGNTTSCMLKDSPQPDGFLRVLRELGGASWEGDDDHYLHGAPELLAETSRTSASYDLHTKFDLYEEAGVAEYLTVLLFEQEIRWHVLKNGKYEIMPADDDGIWRSRIFPGLWLAGKELLKGEMMAVFKTLQDGLASKEHKAFVKELAKRKKKIWQVGTRQREGP